MVQLEDGTETEMKPGADRRQRWTGPKLQTKKAVAAQA
jgi:hypothetical protein